MHRHGRSVIPYAGSPVESGRSTGAFHSRDFRIADPTMAVLGAEFLALALINLLSHAASQGETHPGQLHSAVCVQGILILIRLIPFSSKGFSAVGIVLCVLVLRRKTAAQI